MTTSLWYALTLRVAPEWAELCAEVLRESGCEGVEVRDLQVQFDESEDATLIPLEETEIVGYRHATAPLDVEHLKAELNTELEQGGIAAKVSVAPVEDNDWANSWREHFPPLHAGRFLVAPPWSDAVPAEGEIEITIDPGLAFGTGQHPTTRLCLELLGEYMPQVNPATLLDVGCGSGILSIAAAKLSPQTRIVASDTDQFCVEATEENAARNGVKLEIHQEAGAAWTDAQYDVVVANLMSALLIGMSGELAGAVRPAGLLIVSGISEPRADDVEAALHAVGFQTLTRCMEDGEQRDGYIERWAAFVLQQPEDTEA